MRKHIIVGTSGHIDHGKTALIKHLTGIDADRWEAEKKRGITIDIGFAHVPISENRVIGFIDVPGHERFIKNMLAGAMGMDLVLLIVSAEEGFKPQTLEHLQILKHLDIEKGIVVFTKSDLVDEETLELVNMEADDYLKGTFLENAPRIAYSIYDDVKREALLKRIEESIDAMSAPPAHPSSRLPIDRVFTIKGHGTVVTGTLLEGKIHVEDRLYHYPSNEQVRVKSIQVYGEKVPVAYAGQRVALNLSCDKSMLNRGDVLTSFGGWEASHIVDVSMTVDNGPLKHWQRLRLYHGTDEILCRVATPHQESIGEGETATVQLRLEAPIRCKVNDRFVVRNFSPLYTIGGGLIVNPKAVKHAVSESSEGDYLVDDTLVKHFESLWHPFLYENSLFEHMPFETTACEAAWARLLETGQVVGIEEQLFVSFAYLESLEQTVLELLIDFHQANPLKVGMERETLRSKLNKILYKGKPKKLSAVEFNAVMAYLTAANRVAVNGHFVKEPTFEIVLSKEAENIKRTLISDVKQSGVKPVAIKEIVSKDPKRKKLIEEVLYYLINLEFLVKINEEVVLHKVPYQACKNGLIEYLTSHPSITVAEYRDLMEISRKASVELLEHFDRIQVTKRVENTRTLLNQ